MLKFARINILVLLILSLLFAPIMSQSKASPVLAQDRCEAELKLAEEKYYAGLFDEASNILQQCLDKNDLTPSVKIRALKLLTFAFLAIDYLDQARDALKKLLVIVPTYEPDTTQDPPRFVSLVREMKEAIAREMEKQEQAKEQLVAKEPIMQIKPMKKGGNKTWLFIGGGVAAGLVAVLVAGKGKDDPPPPPELPDPPNLPKQ
ncbi:MAG: hypothetical protein L0287_16040 [Anaerolineae bacterium]|nr:hypothetical protein [Anaerolineae bacterium]